MPLPEAAPNTSSAVVGVRVRNCVLEGAVRSLTLGSRSYQQIVRQNSADTICYVADIKRMLSNCGSIIGVSATISAPTLKAVRLEYDSDQIAIWLSGGTNAARFTVAIRVMTSTNEVRTLQFVVATTGEAPAQLLAGLPDQPVFFERTQVNVASEPVSLTITNVSSAVVAIRSVVTSGNFDQTNDAPTELEPGGSFSVTVTFTPRQIGRNTGSLQLVTDQSVSSAVLYGDGAALPVLTPNGLQPLGSVNAGADQQETWVIVASGYVMAAGTTKIVSPNAGKPANLWLSGVGLSADGYVEYSKDGGETWFRRIVEGIPQGGFAYRTTSLRNSFPIYVPAMAGIKLRVRFTAVSGPIDYRITQ